MSSREKQILAIAVICAVLALFSGQLFPRLREANLSLDREIRLKEKMLERSRDLLAKRSAIDRASQVYKDLRGAPASDEQKNAIFLKEIEALARRAGVGLIDVKTFEPLQQEYSAIYRVEIGVETDNLRLVDFLYDIDASKDLLHVPEYHVRPKKGDPSRLDVRLTIAKLFFD